MFKLTWILLTIQSTSHVKDTFQQVEGQFTMLNFYIQQVERYKL